MGSLSPAGYPSIDYKVIAWGIEGRRQRELHGVGGVREATVHIEDEGGPSAWESAADRAGSAGTSEAGHAERISIGIAVVRQHAAASGDRETCTLRQGAGIIRRARTAVELNVEIGRRHTAMAVRDGICEHTAVGSSFSAKRIRDCEQPDDFESLQSRSA